MVWGGKCFWSPGGPGSTNYFEYTGDCPGRDNADAANGWDGADAFGPDHWFMVVYKDGDPDTSNNNLNVLQGAPIGLTDNTVNPPFNTPHQDSNFQMTLNPDGPGFDTRMNLKAGATDKWGHHIDFDLGNQATDGLQDGNQTLYFHDEIKLNAATTGTTEMSYVLRFSVGNQHFALQYALRPQQNAHLAGAPPCMDFWSDEGTTDHYVTLDATCFGTPKLQVGQWQSVDINWTNLVNWVRTTNFNGAFPSQSWWSNIAPIQTKGTWAGLQFYETVYGNPGNALGSVDTTQRNWVMNYH
jgi:hypothetical protein